MRMTFGLDTALKDDPWVELGFNATLIASRTATFGAFAVDWLPFRAYGVHRMHAWLIMPFM